MKPLLCMLALFAFKAIAFCQYERPIAMGETMANTFNFYGDKLSGTCFMVIKDGKQYFVTAAHLFESSHKSGDVVPVQMLIQNQLQSFNASVYFHADRKVDVAVIRLPEKVSQNVELPEDLAQYKDALQKVFQGRGISMDSTFFSVGTDVTFYGFPLGNLGTELLGMKFPLVKNAMLSGWVKNNGVELLLLDGHNNLGFSGGPVVVYDTAAKKMCVVGVISGYLPEPLSVQHKKDTESVNGNSGIIICYGKHYIEDIFIKNKKELH